MARIIGMTSHGSDDPTKATLAFVTAVGAIGAGKEAGVALLGEGAYLAKLDNAKGVHGVGFPPLSELYDQIINAKVPIYV